MSTKLTDLSLRFFFFSLFQWNLKRTTQYTKKIQESPKKTKKKVANNKAKSNQIDTSPLRIQSNHYKDPFASFFFFFMNLNSLFFLSNQWVKASWGFWIWQPTNKGTKRAEILFSRQDTREDSSLKSCPNFKIPPANTQKE